MSKQDRIKYLTRRLDRTAALRNVVVDALFLKASIFLSRYGNELSSDDFWLLNDLYDPDLPEFVPESEHTRLDRLARLGLATKHLTRYDYGGSTPLGLATLILWLSKDRPPVRP